MQTTPSMTTITPTPPSSSGQLRTHIESAHAAISATAARAPVRTVRARNLSVLLETVDQLFADTVRLLEVAEFTPPGIDPDTVDTTLADIARNLSGASAPSPTASAPAPRTTPPPSAPRLAPPAIRPPPQ